MVLNTSHLTKNSRTFIVAIPVRTPDGKLFCKIGLRTYSDGAQEQL